MPWKRQAGRKDSKHPDSGISIEHVLADGDIVAIHTQTLSSISRPNEGGLRQVHLFRLKDDKIVEYWDISQSISPEMSNAAGAF